jgi:hypothetical protein
LYRGFTLDHPKNGDIQILLNKPTHPFNNFDPTKPPSPSTAQPEVIRAPLNPQPGLAGAQNKKRPQKLSDKSAQPSQPPTPSKKRTPEEIKAAQVKEYLKQAQHQAQMQLHQKAGILGNTQGMLLNDSSFQ